MSAREGQHWLAQLLDVYLDRPLHPDPRPVVTTSACTSPESAWIAEQAEARRLEDTP